MGEFVVDIPDELKNGLEQLSKEEIKAIVSKALKEHLSEKLMFRVADELLKNSEITDELALKWGAELKKRAAAKRR